MPSTKPIWHDGQYNTGLTFDPNGVASFISEKRPETTQEKIQFINNFEHRGGFYYSPQDPSYALNIKLHSAVEIPTEFLAVIDTDWFYQEWHDFNVNELRSQWEEENKGYTFTFAGRSGGYLRLIETQGGRLGTSIGEPEVDEDTEEYDKVYARFDHYQAWWQRFMKLHLHDGHKRRLQQIVRKTTVKHNLEEDYHSLSIGQ